MANKPIKSINLLPEIFRTDKNSKFLSSTVDQLIQPPKLERLDGFIGSKLTPTYVSTSDVYVSETLPLRRDYQLEPALVIKDVLGNVTQVKAIDDLANEIQTEGGINNNFDRLFRSLFYSYDPHIDFDKLVNYQKYYWLTTGPETVEIVGKQINSTSTYSVIDNEIKSAWIFSPDGLTEDPTLILYRGNTYDFFVNSTYKFYIKTAPSLGLDDVYNFNIIGNGVKSGVVRIKIDENTPNILYYTSDDVNYVQGKILIKQTTEDSFIDVEKEILGKVNYTSGTGVKLSNGMKISFAGEVYPEEYKNKEYFVEGVGNKIKLISYELLLGTEKFSARYDDDFDVAKFDEFPFDSFRQLPIDPEYITINRGSKDLNPWTRYNRWVHEDVIRISAEVNGNIPVFPADKRALRPIIEFKPDLQLFNFGSIGVKNVDLIDNEITDAFSVVEGSAGHYIDGILLRHGNRVIFNADTDDSVRGKIYEVNLRIIGGRRKIELMATDDHVPPVGACLSSLNGATYGGKSWWYDGDKWKLAQQHETLNQPPLFDVFDSNGVSFSSNEYTSDFKGSQIFGYEIGTGSPDPVLNFPISFKNTPNVGSFRFKNFFNTDVISIYENFQVSTTTTAVSFLKINRDSGSSFVNVWSVSPYYPIPVLQLYSTTYPLDRLEILGIDNAESQLFNLQVYIDDVLLPKSEWGIVTIPRRRYIRFKNTIPVGKNILLKIFSGTAVSEKGQYETPIGLTNNPLNGPIDVVTLSDMSDHFKSMTERFSGFVGSAFGNNNSRDLPNLSAYGKKLVANINPIAFANFFLGIKEHDVIDAIQKSADQYNQFKLSLLKKMNELGDINDPILALDDIMVDLNLDKDLNSSWYYSDMMPYGKDKTTREWTVTDSRNTIYPIVDDFDPKKLGLRAVLVYLNKTQLILDKDYQFLVNDSSIEILTDLNPGDQLIIEDYFSTEGCYIPATPTKLGLYPKYRPSIYIDNTYINPTKVIQGHDGSITVAFNDFRDDIILEFEKRIYNNIKSEYRQELFDFNKLLPGGFRDTQYSYSEITTILNSDFVKWSSFYNVDPYINVTFDIENTFTWNYRGSVNYIVEKFLPGHWRSLFKYLYDTDRPNTHPWEMLGFSEEPDWWQSEYGPAPYTSGNLLLWNDLENGVIKYGPRAGTDNFYARSGLTNSLPVDQYGNLIDPSTLVTDITAFNIRQNWKFGDHGPVETAWRRSSYYPFALVRLMALTRPTTFSSLFYDLSRIKKNLAGQWTYGDRHELLDLRKIVIHNDQKQLTSGYSVYVSEIGQQRDSNYIKKLKNDLAYLDFNLFHKVGGFVSKNKIQVIIDALDPGSTSPGAILPPESYKLILNTGNPIKTVNISGVIVQRSNGKFLVKGYDLFKQFFTIYKPRRNSNTPAITVGGVSESYVNWQAGDDGGNSNLTQPETITASPAPTGPFYRQGQVVKYGQNFYRTKVSHRSGSSFNLNNFTLLRSLPVIGGATVQIANGFEEKAISIPYGTEFDNIQDVYDLIIGYGQWLQSEGFIFDEYNPDLNEVINWNLSAKEFLFWTTQNWADNSVITLSPFANKVKYTLANGIVDNIFDNFYEYSILKADGLPFPQKKLNVTRDEKICSIDTVNTTDGIYFAQLNLVQKEHAMVFDNRTIFNDTIYDIETGYRQRRMRLVGFRSKDWNGDYFSPGFVYDDVNVKDWQKFTTYVYGDVVRYGGNYYSAKTNIVSTSEFNFNDWAILNEKPQPDLIPNFEYKINQFEDFYSLDIDNFDIAQQKMAQHLIGYNPRTYLNNVFTNPISQYKFYQGYIKEKGTKNAIDKLAKASIFNLQGETKFNEEWAFRLGQFGSFTSFEELETKLEEGTFIENPQIINYRVSRPVNPIDLIFYSTASNIAIQPLDYVASETFATTSTFNFKLPDAGYVSFEDITATAYNENSLLDIANNNQINNGDVIWLGFKSNGSWDVLRYDLLSSRVVGVFVSVPGSEITFVTDLYHGLKPGDIISITKFNEQVNGVYIVKSVPTLNYITVSSDLTLIINEELLSPGLVYKFRSVRTPTFDQLPSDSEILQAPIGSNFWIDNRSTSGIYDWRVYKKIDNFESKQLTSGLMVSDQELGYSIFRDPNTNAVLVSAPGFVNTIDNGRVFVFQKIENSSELIYSYALNDVPNQYHASSEKTEFGYSLSYMDTKVAGTQFGFSIVGAPSASNIKATGTSLKYASASSSIVNATQAGAVKVSSYNDLIYDQKFEAILLSPNYNNYERFGSSVSSSPNNRSLFVGAPGTATTGSGSVYFYQVFGADASANVISTASTGSTVIYVDTTASIRVGQTVWVKDILTDIIHGVKVQSIYDDGISQYVELNQAIPTSIVDQSTINFYSTSTIISTSNLYTNTNGTLFSFVGTYTAVSASTGDEYGFEVKTSYDGNVLAISAPGGDYVETIVNVGTPNEIRAVHTSTFGTGIRFGDSLAISKSGEYMFVGAPDVKNQDDSFGKVAVYARIGNTFTFTATLVNPLPSAGLKFGKELSIGLQTSTLAVSAIGLNNNVPVFFDSTDTSFDSSSTYFYDKIDNFGTVYLYQKEPTSSRYVLSAEIKPTSDGDFAGTNFGYSVAVDNNAVFVGSPCLDIATTSSFYQFTKKDSTVGSLAVWKTRVDTVDIDTIQQIKLINTFDDTIVDYLDIFDPLKGKIPGIAEQELRYRSAYDPAIYSIGTAGVVVDNSTSWLDEHVGELWWDISTVKYVWYEQGDLVYRKNNWGEIFPGATIDVYEWVESKYLPAEWSVLADTSEGLTEGISGQPKYVDNAAFAVKQIYNSITNSFNNVYYFWVKNKVTIPPVRNRRISSYQVSSIIADPIGYGIKTASIISRDAISLGNVGQVLVGDRINLNISYDKIKNKVEKHTEWTLMEENSVNSMPPVLYEKKLFDSLLGKDSLGNPVPDPALSERVRYGIEIRPRQALFKDRKEALRNLIEFTNEILIQNQITGSYSFNNLNEQENYPNILDGEYDQIVEDNEGLNIIDTRILDQASLSCTVLNGRIRSVSIIKPGFGYKIAPKVQISNSGFDAVIETKIDSVGRIIAANIINAGRGYTSAPTLTVRPFSVLVLSDNLYNGKWTKFEWNKIAEQWERKQTQKYNTTLYWKYVDWQSKTYNEFIDYSFTVEQVYQLDTLETILPGQYVKIKNIGDGRYAIVEKAEEGQQGTFGKGFNLVYSQNGTIQILDSIWDLKNNNLGFDQNNNYDQTLYDQMADIELFYILTAIKDDIFVNELKLYWNLFFFKAVKYALTEQKSLNWAFKTSFINVTNYAGTLDQRPVYKLKTSENYEEYIKEVKPYHSQIRSFTANHEILEPSNSFFSDFDNPAFYNPSTDSFENVNFDSPQIVDLPWKAWYDNYTFIVGEIIVGDGGSGYLYPPQVTIETAPGDSGSGATAQSFISSGKVYKIEVTNPGSNYKTPPNVILSGGGDADLQPARVYAQLYNGKIRNNKIGLKFDRISRLAENENRNVQDSFICDGSKAEFVLNWFADSNKQNITVTLNDELVLGSDYRVVEYRELFNGYKKKYSKIVFTKFVPTYGQTLIVKYLKNIEIFDAAQRIKTFYTATSGMPGNDLAQLMAGVEYPGVSLTGVEFDYANDWDISYKPFGLSSYADNVGYFNKVSVIEAADIGTDTVTVSTTTGIVVNQYVNLISAVKSQSTQTLFSAQIADSNFDVKVVAIITATSKVKFNSTLSQSLAGTSTNVYIQGQFTTVTNTATLELWTYDSNFSVLDTALDGGSWSTVTNLITGALGVSPTDIIIDGDGFITPNTSYAPEEFVNGEAHDSVGISVFTRYTESSPIIYNGTIDIYSGTITTASMTVIPPTIASLFVTYAGKNFYYTTTTDHLTDINRPEFNIDWATNELIIGPQSTTGKLGYTIIGVGGGSPLNQPHLLDHVVRVVTDGDARAEILSISSTQTVRSAYVTVNGVGIPKLPNPVTYELGYLFYPSPIDPTRAAVRILNLTANTATIQAWFFGSVTKHFNEIKEEIFEIGSTATTSLVISQPPGNIEPAAANIIVEIFIPNLGYRRLQGPYISYYKASNGVRIYKIDNNIDRIVPSFDDENVRVYLNGRKLLSGPDYYFNYDNQTIETRRGLLVDGDVLAIVGRPTAGLPLSEYDIESDTINFVFPIGNTKIRVITFTNHDTMMLRTETFYGNMNRRFKVSRNIVNSNYVWVSVDGIVLVNGIDYTVLDDQRTIELSGKWKLDTDNLVVITTVSSDRTPEKIVGHRIFRDIFGRTHYKRLSKSNTTYLTRPLYSTDTEIHVANADVLTAPSESKKIPGVIMIDGERIEFYQANGNVLTKLRRSTLGTGPARTLISGSKVIDQGINQNIPYSDKIYKQTILTNSSTSTYNISAVDVITTTTVGGDQMYSDKIVLSTTSTVNPIDQIEVYYGGRRLRKTGMYIHDESIGYDSPMANVVGSTSSTSLLPVSDVENTAYIITSTNQVWVYTGSLESDAINGYVYRGLKYIEPEFTVTISINTVTAATYANTASMMAVGILPDDLAYDINGDEVVTNADALVYSKIANNIPVININKNSNYGNLLQQQIHLNIDGGVKDNIRLTIVQKGYEKTKIWNDTVSESLTKSLIDSTTLPARFLQASYAELPDEFYYGGDDLLVTNSGIPITTNDNEPLEGL